MGRDWDKAVPSVEIWQECLRVLKPGAFALVMCLPRQDVLSQMIVRLGQAGFNTEFTSIYWVYSTGFPKALNIAKGITAKEKVGGSCPKHLRKVRLGDDYKPTGQEEYWKGRAFQQIEGDDKPTELTETAKKFDGAFGGFQPKPAVELILVCMKPLSEKTYTEQALKNGKGITWLDDCRIPIAKGDEPQGGFGDMDIGIGKPLQHQEYRKTKRKPRQAGTVFKQSGFKAETNDVVDANPKGRFPANLLVSDDMLNTGKVTKSTGGVNTGKLGVRVFGEFANEVVGDNAGGLGDEGSYSRYFSLDMWFAKVFNKLPPEVQRTFPFIVEPKAPRSEKNKGCEDMETVRKCRWNNAGTWQNLETTQYGNIHPSVKPIDLMCYLVTLGSREGDLVVDPFMGSGTTGIACKLLNRRFIGMEKEQQYFDIAKSRLNATIVTEKVW